MENVYVTTWRHKNRNMIRVFLFEFNKRKTVNTSGTGEYFLHNFYILPSNTMLSHNYTVFVPLCWVLVAIFSFIYLLQSVYFVEGHALKLILSGKKAVSSRSNLNDFTDNSVILMFFSYTLLLFTSTFEYWKIFRHQILQWKLEKKTTNWKTFHQWNIPILFIQFFGFKTTNDKFDQSQTNSKLKWCSLLRNQALWKLFGKLYQQFFY